MEKDHNDFKSSSLRNKISGSVYNIHLIIALVFSTYILIKNPKAISPSITFVMLIIYGYMIVWNLLFSYLLILCKQYEKTIILNRIIVKLIIIVFPIFGILSKSSDDFLEIHQISVFVFYMTIVSFILLIYQIVCCIWFCQKYPEFIYSPNNLQAANQKINQKRMEYNEFIRSQS